MVKHFTTLKSKQHFFKIFFWGSSKSIFGFKMILSHAKTPNIEFFFFPSQKCFTLHQTQPKCISVKVSIEQEVDSIVHKASYS